MQQKKSIRKHTTAVTPVICILVSIALTISLLTPIYIFFNTMEKPDATAVFDALNGQSSIRSDTNLDRDPANDDSDTNADIDGTIRGRVIWEIGEPIEEAKVSIIKAGVAFEFVFTGNAGSYIFDRNVSEGTYTVSAGKTDVFSVQQVTGVVVGEGETVWVNFTIPLGGGS